VKLFKSHGYSFVVWCKLGCLCTSHLNESVLFNRKTKLNFQTCSWQSNRKLRFSKFVGNDKSQNLTAFIWKPFDWWATLCQSFAFNTLRTEANCSCNYKRLKQVPKLSLSMYPFSISIDEHVPLNMSAGMIFSRGGPKYFCRVKVAKLDFHHSKLRKQPFFKKMWWENALALLPTPMPLKLLMAKRLRKIAKIYSPIGT